MLERELFGKYLVLDEKLAFDLIYPGNFDISGVELKHISNKLKSVEDHGESRSELVISYKLPNAEPEFYAKIVSWNPLVGTWLKRDNEGNVEFKRVYPKTVTVTIWCGEPQEVEVP